MDFSPKRKRAPDVHAFLVQLVLFKKLKVIIRKIIVRKIVILKIIIVYVIDFCIPLTRLIVAVTLFLILRIAFTVAARLTASVRGCICRCGEYHSQKDRDNDEERDNTQDPPRDLYQYKGDARQYHDGDAYGAGYQIRS